MRSKIRIFVTSILLGVVGFSLGMMSGPSPEQRDMLRAIDEGSILAWGRHITGQDPNNLSSFDKFESVAVIPGSSNRANGDARHDDEVWVSTRRHINGVWVRYIEQFQPLDWGEDPNYCWFVDAAGYGTSAGSGGSSGPGYYPTLQALTAAEIPVGPDAPADIALVAPISITDAAGLQGMHQGHHYSIDADIDLTKVTWTPLAWTATTGAIVVEGNNHTISNLTLVRAVSKTGFIGQIGANSGAGPSGGGQVRNLKFANCHVTGTSDLAVFCGWFYPLNYYQNGTRWSFKNITVENSTVTVTPIVSTRTDIGIVFGEFATEVSSIVNCTVTNCTITATSNVTNVGGLIGNFNSTAYDPLPVEGLHGVIRDCTSSGTLNLTGPVLTSCGGLIGASPVKTHYEYVVDCSSTVNLAVTVASNNGHADAIGGLIGAPGYLQLVSCYTTGSVTVANGAYTGQYLRHIGGFAGGSNRLNHVINCYCTGAVTIGGVAAWASVTNVGGFIGLAGLEDTWLRCYSTSSLTFNNTITSLYIVGGFCGDVDSGQVRSSFSRCWAEGDITFNGNITAGSGGSGNDAGHGYGFIGGFIGYWDYHATIMGSVQNCYTWSSTLLNGSYPANLTVGGFLAGFGSDIADLVFENCYCAQTDVATSSGYTGQIPALADAHGFGQPPVAVGSVTAVFYDTTTSSLATSDIGEGHPVDWMMTKQNYVDAGWDFNTIWYSTQTEANPWANLAPQLDGERVCVYADAQPRGTFLVDGTDITDFNEADYSVIIAGLNYYSILETNSLHRRGLGRMATIQDVQVNFHNTMGAHVGSDMTYSADWRFFQKDYLMKSAPARNIGGGIVGLPYSGEPFSAGEVVYLYGTTNYNGLHTLAADTNNVELRITASYVAETFDGTEWVVHNTPWQPWSGYKGPAPFLRGTNRQPDVYLWEWDCIPMTIRSLTANMEVTVE